MLCPKENLIELQYTTALQVGTTITGILPRQKEQHHVRTIFLTVSFVNIHVNSGDAYVWTTECQMFDIRQKFLFTTCVPSFFIFSGTSTSNLFFLCLLSLLQHM